MDADALSGVAKAVEGFASGWERGQDRKLKQMEIESKINAEKEMKDRQKTKDEMEVKDKEFDNRMKVIGQNRKLPSLGEGESITGYDLSTLPLDQEALQAKTDADPMARAIKAMQFNKEQDEAQKRSFEKTTEGKVGKLSGDQRKRFDDVTGATNALAGVSAAYGAKDRTNITDNSDLLDIPLRGDTDYTRNRNLFVESLGRLQSGGAISHDEVANFKALLPKPTDNPKIAQKKLEDLDFMLSARLKSFGVSKEDATQAGFLKPGLVQPGLVGNAGPAQAGMFPSGQPAQAPVSHPQDSDAVKWARANSKDPRAKEILRMNGIK